MVEGVGTKMKTFRTFILNAMCILFVGIGLSGCLNIKLYGPCDVPRNASREELFGVWQLSYDSIFLGVESSPREGEEIVTLRSSGVYSHTFTSGDYSYHDQGQQWELILDTIDSPKLRMHNMKYFAAGIAESDRRLDLGVPMVDSLKIQKHNLSLRAGEDWVDSGVSYPSDGFIYLFIRLCEDELSLVQMESGITDPDNRLEQNPVFQRR